MSCAIESSGTATWCHWLVCYCCTCLVIMLYVILVYVYVTILPGHVLLWYCCMYGLQRWYVHFTNCQYFRSFQYPSRVRVALHTRRVFGAPSTLYFILKPRESKFIIPLITPRLRAYPNIIVIVNRRSTWQQTGRWLVPGSSMFPFLF